VLLEVIACVLFFPVLTEYFKTGLVPRFPTLIVSGMIAVVGILMWICGIILQVISKKHRQLFELYLYLLQQKEQ
jgi:hypothetical protein